MFSTITISSLYDAALAVVYPQVCAVCEGSVESRLDGVACGGCWAETRMFSAGDSLCWKCGALTFGILSEPRNEDVRCRRCADAQFTAARACGRYHEALRAVIIELKRSPHVPRRLESLMVETCRRPPLDRATLIVPVPLHPQRERERGFNQATMLANSLSGLVRLPLVEHALARTAPTALHRAGMDAQARRESVENAFAVTQPQLISGEHILLVDDVFTTGATVSACSRVLLEAGAEEVSVFTLARRFDTR